MANRSTSSQQFSLSLTGRIANLLVNNKQAAASINGDLIAESFSNGVSAWEMNRAHEETDIELLSGNSVDIDLRDVATRDAGAGTGDDAVGQVQLFEEIVCLIVKHTDGDGELEINTVLPASPWPVIPQYAARSAVGGALRLNGVRVWFEPDTQALDTTAGGANVRFTATNGDLKFSLLIFGRHDDDESSSSSSSSTSSNSSSVSSVSSSSSSSIS
jgi:hypothetical protein